jgi:site-specific recombinase XerD
MRVYLRANRTDKKGMSVIYFIVGDEWISTGIKCNTKFWDEIAGVFKRTAPNYLQDGPALLSLKAKAESCLAVMQLEHKPFSKDYFLQVLQHGKDAADNPCFLKLMDEYCHVNTLSWQRVKHYNELQKDITALLVRPKLSDINFNFINRFKVYLKTKKGKPNNENTITRKIKQLKAVVHYCQKKGLLQNDTLAMVRLKEIKGNKQHLNADELATLEKLYAAKVLNDSQQTCLQYFLFSCYTGLRYSDITRLNRQHLHGNTISIVQEKTDKPVFVPLIEKAVNLIAIQQNGKLFKTFCNQPTNRMLKEIMLTAGIEKNISYHCSRHTFGTLSIYWGIPKEVVAEIMGVDMKTVNVYAKMLEEVKVREMQKWGKVAV